MIINTNLSALSTFNALNKNSEATDASIKKLSTGLRINSASDDAAGLAISEKMRGQISGLSQASSNAQDGISMLQTAEGGLDQTHSILQRMRELAVQSSSDTNTSDDRGKIQSEVDQLSKEITRISNTTEFNTQNLLAGGLSDTFHIGANANQTLSVSVSAMDAQSLGVAGSLTSTTGVKAGGTGLNIVDVGRGLAAGTGYKITVAVTAATVGAAVNTQLKTDANNLHALTVTGFSSFTGTSNTDFEVKVSGVTNTANTSSVTAISYSNDGGSSWTSVTGDFNTGVAVQGLTMKFGNAAIAGNSGVYTSGDQFDFTANASYNTLQLQNTVNGVANTNVGASVAVHSGDTTATVGDASTSSTFDLQFNYSKLAAGSNLTANVKTSASTVATVNEGVVTQQATVTAGIDVSDEASANKAITVIDNAINTVSQQRSQLGAYENRLTNTIDNLNTSNENITAAESRIRDVDMASEMSNYQKNNILQSAATSMLAKANTQPQSVLQLLQG